MAHFIEHVIFKGTKKRRAYHILSRLDDVGGDLNAYTTKEETAFYASFLSGHYERSIELISDIVFSSVFPENELAKEREVIIDEINSYKDSPSELIFDDFEELIYDGHPIGRNILGTPESIRGFGRKQIEEFLAELFGVPIESADPLEEAMRETQDAIRYVLGGAPSIDLKPQPSHVRRQQHQAARSANLISHSHGRDPYRYVRIYRS